MSIKRLRLYKVSLQINNKLSTDKCLCDNNVLYRRSLPDIAEFLMKFLSFFGTYPSFCMQFKISDMLRSFPYLVSNKLNVRVNPFLNSRPVDVIPPINLRNVYKRSSLGFSVTLR